MVVVEYGQGPPVARRQPVVGDAGGLGLQAQKLPAFADQLQRQACPVERGHDRPAHSPGVAHKQQASRGLFGRAEVLEPRGLQQGGGGAATEAGDAGGVLGAGHEQTVVGGQLSRGGVEGPADQPKGPAAVGLAGQPARGRGIFPAQHQQGTVWRRGCAAQVVVAEQQP